MIDHLFDLVLESGNFSAFFADDDTRPGCIDPKPDAPGRPFNFYPGNTGMVELVFHEPPDFKIFQDIIGVIFI
jgi:hypothetical protein